VRNPDGAHSIACGLDADLDVQIHGHVGYSVAGMNKHVSVTVHGNAGPGAAENMMSGRVQVKGFASMAAGASAHGGLLIIDGDASLRCGISLKGDLPFLAASLSRYPLEGYRERCATKTVLGTRFASRPIELAIPVTVAGMSFGALSARVKEALGRAATRRVPRPQPATAA
jgi:glutamate synthase domain-containing protein 2